MEYFKVISDWEWIFFGSEKKIKHPSNKVTNYFKSIYVFFHFCTWFTLKGFHWVTGTYIWTNVVLKDIKHSNYESIRYDNIEKQGPVAEGGGWGGVERWPIVICLVGRGLVLRSKGLVQDLQGSVTIFSKNKTANKYRSIETKLNKTKKVCNHLALNREF